MGYRLRIGRISKKAYDKYKDIESYEKVIKEAGLKEHASIVYELPEYEEIYEIGKYVDYSNGTSPFFKFDLEECEFSIASKEWLLSLIEVYRKKTERWYEILSKALFEDKDKPKEKVDKIERINFLQINKEMYVDDLYEEFPALELFHHINSRLRLWKGNFVKPYSLKDNNTVSGDWSYEYSVFNLVHILHTFDWDNDLMIYSGW